MSQGMQYEDFSEVDRWQKDFRPEQGQRPGPEALPAGSYEFKILSASLEMTRQDKPQPIFKLVLQVQQGERKGMVIERTNWFARQDSVNWLGGDFVTLGIQEAFEWATDRRPLSELIREACPRLIGLACSGTRVDSDKRDEKGKPYANLYLNSLLHHSPMPPAQKPVAVASANSDEEDIPF